MYPGLTWLAPIAVVSALLTPVTANAVVAITEILKDPCGGESDCPGGGCLELVEVTNLGPDTLTTDSLFITDGTTVDSVVPWPAALDEAPAVITGRTVLPPHRVAVIVDRQYTDAPQRDRFTFADSTILWTVNHVSIAGGLSRDKGLLLYRGTPDHIEDSVAAALDPGQTATMGSRLTHTSPSSAREGYSLTPSHLLFPGTTWTPGRDSLSPGSCPALEDGWVVEYRLGATSARASSVPCTLGVHHITGQAPNGARWRLRRADTRFVVAEDALAEGATPRYIATRVPTDTVLYQVVLEHDGLRVARDLDLSTVWLPASPLKITELFPRATEDLPEWLEITNTSGMPIDLRGWRFGTPEAADTISTVRLVIEPGAYLVLTKDRELFAKTYAVAVRAVEPLHWQALDNYRDTVLLWSPLDSVPAETVCYNHEWFDAWGYESLARIDPLRPATGRSGWAVAAGPTPGQPNTAVAWRAANTPSLSIGPTPFSPNGDGRDDRLAVRLRLPASHRATLTIYGFDGDVLYRFPTPLAEKQYWDGATEARGPAPVGPFFVVAEISDGNEMQSIRAKGILWR